MDKLKVERVTEFINRFEDFSGNPEEFLKSKEYELRDTKLLVKDLYDLVKSLEVDKKGNALPELIIDNFDEEQIWQEIELQNNDKLNKFKHDVTKICTQADRLLFPVRLKTEEVTTEEFNDNADDEEEEEEEEMKIEIDDENEFGEELSDNDSSDIDLIDNKNRKSTNKAKQRTSEVDDDFFKLSEMEEFLLAEEKKEEKDPDNSDFGVDLFDDMPSEDEVEGENEDKVLYRYKDFFAEPKNKLAKVSNKGDGFSEDDENYNLGSGGKSEDEIQSDAEEMASSGEEENKEIFSQDKGESKKKVKFSLSNEESESEEETDSDEHESKFVKKGDKEKSENKSALDKRKDRLSRHISHLEETMLSEKPWQMRGEVSATSRPQNSLLEEVLEFDRSARPAPVVTEETTERLEDIIIRRIKDKAWDDVVKKLKPVETVNEFKKRLVLDQEKSKLSLAQIYEQEYVKQRDAAATAGVVIEDKEPEELPEHKQIKSMMVSLFSKLNALANYHYTPKAAAPDVKIISNLPAVTMEEVAPVATSNAALLAPEEVLGKKKRDLIGKEERTTTDKKRERRKKKKWQKKKRKQQELRESQKPGVFTKERAAEYVKKFANTKGVKISSTDNKAVKTSTAFFTKLQDEVKLSISEKTKQKRQMPSVNAKRLKL